MLHQTETLKPKQQKVRFSNAEDILILDYVKENGTNNWTNILQILPGRSIPQIRERYRLYLDPSVTNKTFTTEENIRLLQLAEKYQQKWSQIAKLMTGELMLNSRINIIN